MAGGLAVLGVEGAVEGLSMVAVDMMVMVWGD
jgi:hypothetical protein